MKHWWMIFGVLLASCGAQVAPVKEAPAEIAQVNPQAILPLKLSSTWASPNETLTGTINATTPTTGTAYVIYQNQLNTSLQLTSTATFIGSGKLKITIPRSLRGGQWNVYVYYAGNYYLSGLNVAGYDTNGQYMMLLPGYVSASTIITRLSQLGYTNYQIINLAQQGADLGTGSLCSGTMVVVNTGRPAGESISTLQQGFPEAEGHVDPKTLPGVEATSAYPAHLIAVGAPAAFSRNLNGAGVEIAILDTGVNAISGTTLLPGRDFVAVDDNPADEFIGTGTSNGHGTQVAMLAAGKTQGVAQGAKIRAVRVCDKDGKCDMEKVFIGTCWALKNAVDRNRLVLNLSLGSETPVNLFADLFKEANSYGTLIAVAGGNQGQKGNIPQYPAGFAPKVLGMVSVSGVNGNTPAADATRANYNSIAAPFTFRLQNLQGSFSSYAGTSFSTPMVAGAMALWRQKNPSWSPAEIVKDMKAKARVPSGWVSGYGTGILDMSVAP
ncbi:S8 family peptidase [Deinococcus cellulosilyticus]|uniref:Peptidase S8/S53 domain-containing protein n=1 Tax=Deinococcus cellulosilyticus (strain DSM 18568 / NBRC 106333 / KACC 11606 / 5516J-15) TaxID=1223518 RepID=A0A511NBK9_DEIC1|nr:S8 family serine peptidase [Deinococcus cellulosilyticus]GEM49956.1 hypothetical protein DC3_55910 [Deinococcus cellulosilyticus NBRC 106333 = KACC 11606]